jgi:hypothetical protein
LLSVELAVLAVLGLLLVQGGVESLPGELGADAPDGVAVDVQRLGDALVGPAVGAIDVCPQQDAGAAPGVGGVGAGVDDPLQRDALFGRQTDLDFARRCGQDDSPDGALGES